MRVNGYSNMRFESLDGLKALLCIIIVFFQHYDWLLPDGYGMSFPLRVSPVFYERGYYCVETFFMISGFLLACHYKLRIRGKDEIRDCASLSNFLVKRMMKLYPLLILTLLVTTSLQFVYRFVSGHWFYVESVSIYSFLMSLLNVSSGWFVNDVNLNMPIWFVSTLMLCYIIWYMIARYLKSASSYRSACCVIVLLGISIFLNPIRMPFFYENSVRGYYCFFIGVLLYELFEYTKRYADGNEKIKFYSRGLFLSLVLVVIASYLWGIDCVLGQPQLLWGSVLSPILVWSSVSLGSIMKVLSVRPLVLLGKLSTSIYFWHFSCYQFIRIIAEKTELKIYYSEAWFYVIVIAYILTISILSHTIIEPRIIFKRKMKGLF